MIRFTDPGEPDLLLLAEQLIRCFSSAAERGVSVNILEEELALFRRHKEPKVVDGLIKLLRDRTETVPSGGICYPELRRSIFSRTAGNIAGCRGDLAAYQCRIKELSGHVEDIYGDLPGFEKITGFSSLKPEELLRRYNLALAQGMLFFAGKMEIDVSDPEPAELRRMLKYLKFFRLLAEIKTSGRSGMKLEISGPYSIFGPTRKYALNLAVFLPAVVRLKKWRVSAELVINDRRGKLLLDESSGLVSHYRNFSSYVPEEVKMFHRLFAQKSENWKIIGDTPVIHAGKQQFIIPDISFENSDGKVIHLELFHRWHRTQLQQRLSTLGTVTLPVIAGIDRSIMDNAEYEELLARAPQLKKRLFRFSDFPGVETVLRLLDRQ